jgi:hypothetical protein
MKGTHLETNNAKSTSSKGKGKKRNSKLLEDPRRDKK